MNAPIRLRTRLGTAAGILGLALLAGCRAPVPESFDRIDIPSPSLAGSIVPNPPSEPALVFTPPGYADSERAYPAVYYLPGFYTRLSEYLDGSYDGLDLGAAYREAMREESGEPFLLVVVNDMSGLGGAFFVNSPVTGNWEDFLLADVIPAVESRYRVLADPAHRGVAGESTGGASAIRMAMRHPDVFGSVCAVSPFLFDRAALTDYGVLSAPYRRAVEIETATMRAWPAAEAGERLAGWIGEIYAAGGRFNSRRGFLYAWGAAFAPDPGAGPPFIALPFTGDAAQDSLRRARFEAGFGDLDATVRANAEALRSLQGVALDIGTADLFPWLPRGVRTFAALLDSAGVDCTLTEHGGGHARPLGERLETVLFPFFGRVFGAATETAP